MSELPKTTVAPVTETDEDLMALIQAGEVRGMELLHSRYTGLVRSLARGVLHNEADAEDLVQEVFLTVWTRAGSYDVSKGKPLPWLCTLTRRRAIDRLRRKECYNRFEERLAESTAHHSEGWNHVHEDLAQSERSSHLSRAMQGLPEAQRDAIQFAYGDDLTQSEIASRTGLPMGTIKTRIKLGLQKLAACLHGHKDLLKAEFRTAIV